MINTYARWLLRVPLIPVVLCLLVVTWAGYGMRYLTFKTDYRMFFSKENPQLTAFEVFQNIYTRSDNVMLVLTPANGDVFSRENLEIAEKLTKDLWQTPYSTRVDSITNFQHSYAVEDNLIVGDLVHKAHEYKDKDLARVRDIAINEPLLRDRLISPNSKVMGFNVVVTPPNKNSNTETMEISTFIRNLAEKLRQDHPSLDVRITGTKMIDVAFSEASEHDLSTLTPLMLGIVIIALWWFLRSGFGTLAAVIMMTLSIITAVGLAGWTGIAFSPSSVPAPTILLTLAVADAVHMLIGYYGALQHGLNKLDAMVESLVENFNAVFFTNLTTAISFWSMNFSDAPPFRDLGNITAMGVIATYVLTVVFLPPLTILLPTGKLRTETHDSVTFEKLLNFIIRRQQSLYVFLVLLTVGLFLCIPLNTLDDDYIKYFDTSIAFRRDTDYTAAHLTGIHTLEYSLSQGTAGGISEPKFLKQVEAFVQWYRQQPETTHVFAITDILKHLNKNLHGDAPEWYRLPETRPLAAQYLLLFEMSLPYGLDLNDRINVDKSATRVTVTVRNITTQQMIRLEARAQAWIANNAPLLKNTDGTGSSLLFAHISERNIISMINGELLSIFIICGILILVFKSVTMGIVSLIPNIVPAGMAFGLWGILVGQVGMASSVVAAMTLGILIDDTVHFLGKYSHARRKKKLTPEQALHYAFSKVGNALWVTSTVLILGFGIFVFSNFKINKEMGLLTAIIFALGLFAEFLLLPPLLLSMESLVLRFNRLFNNQSIT